ncbi:MAG TPA: hypothetical protein VFO18_04335 [Methylomirabilota bacterium]|nr:hypothetical protein [Methylomirabilota bacterium]
MTNRTKGVLVLVLLLAGFPLIAALPYQIGAIRLAGLSLLWWYGGVAAPLAAWLVAVVCLSGSQPGRHARPE